MRSSPARIVTAILLAVLLTAWGTPAQEPVPPVPGEPPPTSVPLDPAAGEGRIVGKVVGKDGKAPVAGAVVRTSHLRTGGTLASAPTDSRGNFELTHVPYGYVDLVVETPDGGFVVSRVLNVAPDRTQSVTLVLTRNEDVPQDWWAGRQPRTVPGTETPAVGVATVRESGGGFLRGPKGIALLAGAGVLAILALSGGESEAAASPSQ
jgi:hypothetical protein